MMRRVFDILRGRAISILRGRWNNQWIQWSFPASFSWKTTSPLPFSLSFWLSLLSWAFSILKGQAVDSVELFFKLFMKNHPLPSQSPPYSHHSTQTRLTIASTKTISIEILRHSVIIIFFHFIFKKIDIKLHALHKNRH